MANKITTISATGVARQILFCTEPCVAVGAVISATGVAANSEGKKLMLAGTPVTGDFTARTTPFTAATTGDGTNAVGILLHDVDVTNGDENGTVLMMGFVDIAKLDSTVAVAITTQVKAALPTIKFLK